MNQFTIYRVSDGKMLRTFVGPEGMIDLQLRDGEAACEGIHDTRCCRFNIVSGEIETFVPAHPDSHFEWDDVDKRFALTAAAKTSDDAMQRIQFLERAQDRVVREFLIDPDKVGADGKTPRQRLQEIEDEAADKRKDVRP